MSGVARGLGDAKTPPHGRASAEPSTGQEQSHRDAQPPPGESRGSRVGRLAAYIRSFKGHMQGPSAVDSALACHSGQACLLVFGAQKIVFAVVHTGQLLSVARFVSCPDQPLPHESLTLRWVRVLDILCSLGLGLSLARLSMRLRRKAISGCSGRKVLLQTIACVSAAYVVGALADYAQCHYQGGGIGPHCNGFNCLRVSMMLAAAVAVGQYQPRFFWSVCFGAEGLHRMWWVLSEKREVWVLVSVLLTSALLFLLIAVLFVEDLVRWEIGRSKRSEEAEDAKGVQSDVPVSIA